MTSGRADYIQEGLDAESSTPIALDEDFGFTAADVESDHDNYNQGLATRLYRLGRQGLQNLCRQKKNIPQLDSSQSALREELGKLYLWGEAFENGDLDKALEQSEDLRNTVLEFLCAIGDSIIRASQLYAPSTVESAASPEYMQDLRILVEEAKSFMPSNVDEALSEGSEDEGEYGMSKEEIPDEDNGIVGELQLHIGCLIDLGPTLEKCFLCTRNGRVRSSQRPRRASVKHVGSHMEEIALMALPRDPLDDSEDKSVISGEDSIETSRLVASGGFTLNDSLPRLGATGSSGSLFSMSVSEGLGERQINRALRIRVPDPDGALEPSLLPTSRRADQEAVLECPFIFLKCSRQFDISNEGDWIHHSLEHFRIDGKRPRRVDPPRVNSCCFCSETFQASSGISSWRARMHHVKIHQQHFGHRLATARHDFALVEYLWQQGVLSLVDYRELKPKSKAVDSLEGDLKSFSPLDPGSLVDVKIASKAPRDSERGAAQALEGDLQSFSPRDPDSLVDVKVASKAPRDSERGAVHSRRK